MGPTWLQHDPNMPQTGPKMSQHSLKMLQHGPIYTQIDSKMASPGSILRAATLQKQFKIHGLGRFGGTLLGRPIWTTRTKNTFPCSAALIIFYHRKSKSHSFKKRHSVYYKVNSIDIEVLIASQYNPVLIRWLIHIRDQLQVRKHKKNSVWAKRVIRYIHSTTGPESFKRFLRKPTNQALLRTLRYIPSNNFSHAQELTRMEECNFQVLSFQSNSYFGHKKAFQTSVGDGEGPLERRVCLALCATLRRCPSQRRAAPPRRAPGRRQTGRAT